jgi:hypothetical protein
VFGGFVKGRERVFWVCVIGLMLVLMCVLTGLGVAPLVGRTLGPGGWMAWVGFDGGLMGGRVLLLRVYLLTELRVFGWRHLVSRDWVESEVD